MEINKKKSRNVSVFVSWFKGGSVTVQDDTQNVTIHFNDVKEVDSLIGQLNVLKKMWEKKNGTDNA